MRLIWSTKPLRVIAGSASGYDVAPTIGTAVRGTRRLKWPIKYWNITSGVENETARLFDLDERYEALSQQGDPLEVIDNTIQCSTFQPILNKIQKKNRKSNAGRKPYDPIRMFKILVLQSGYNLSDEQTEYPIKDR